MGKTIQTFSIDEEIAHNFKKTNPQKASQLIESFMRSFLVQSSPDFEKYDELVQEKQDLKEQLDRLTQRLTEVTIDIEAIEKANKEQQKTLYDQQLQEGRDLEVVMQRLEEEDD